MSLVKVLYISYDGILEPLGQSQVLSYLQFLSNRQLRFFLITFEKARGKTASREYVRIQKQLSERGIDWTYLHYHKTPRVLATSYDILAGVIAGIQIGRRHRIKIIHARGFIPALITLVLQRVLRVEFLFDMRGFWADERVQGGILTPSSGFYHLAKSLEKFFLKRAGQIISLT